MIGKPTKIYELFATTGRARSPPATNSITLRAGRYRLIPALQAILPEGPPWEEMRGECFAQFSVGDFFKPRLNQNLEVSRSRHHPNGST